MNPTIVLSCQTVTDIKKSDWQINWSESYLLSDGDNYGSYRPNIVVDSKNNIHVVWYDESQARMEIFYRKYDYNDQKWLDAEIISNVSALKHSKYPVIKIDNQDYIHVIWRNSGSPGSLNYRYSDGFDWFSIMLIDETFDNIFSHDLVPINDNEIFFVWTDDNYELLYRNYSITESVWSLAKLHTNTTSVSLSPKIVADASNNIHLIWLDSSENMPNNEIHYQYFNGINWYPNNPLIVSTIDEIRPAYLSIVVEKTQKMHILWLDYDDIFTIKYQTITNGLLQNELCISNKSETSSFPAFVADSNKNLHFTWSSTMGINYRYRTNQGLWMDIIPVIESSQLHVVPQIIVDSHDNIHIVWERIHLDSSWEIYYIKGKIMVLSDKELLLIMIGMLQHSSLVTIIVITIIKKKMK